MSYLNALAMAASPMGAPPPTRAASLGQAPPVPASVRSYIAGQQSAASEPAQPHVEPPPYDVANDAGWQALLHPGDHPMRNFLNGLSPEERQMLLQWAARLGRLPIPGATPNTF